MGTIRPQDLNFVLSRTPKDIRELMKKYPLFLAGGFIRATIAGERPSDIDLFGPSKEMLDTISTEIALNRKGRKHASDNAITVLAPPRIPVQFITKWTYERIDNVIESFDFTVCQAAICWGCTAENANPRWISMASDAFYPDLAARRLVYTFPKREEAAGGSMMRVRKFLTRGYNIQAPSLAGVMTRVFMSVRDPYGMTEEGLSKVIAGILHEVDPLIVVDGVDFIDEHQVMQEPKAEGGESS